MIFVCVVEVFKKKANEYVGNIREAFPDVEAQLNPDKPRKGAFNISVQVSSSKGQWLRIR